MITTEGCVKFGTKANAAGSYEVAVFAVLCDIVAGEFLELSCCRHGHYRGFQRGRERKNWCFIGIASRGLQDPCDFSTA